MVRAYLMCNYTNHQVPDLQHQSHDLQVCASILLILKPGQEHPKYSKNTKGSQQELPVFDHQLTSILQVRPQRTRDYK